MTAVNNSHFEVKIKILGKLNTENLLEVSREVKDAFQQTGIMQPEISTADVEDLYTVM